MFFYERESEKKEVNIQKETYKLVIYLKGFGKIFKDNVNVNLGTQ